MMSVADRSTVVVGDIAAQTLKAFLSAVSRPGVSLSPEAKQEVVEGVIERSGFEVAGGATTYYFVLNSRSGISFSSQAAGASPEMILARAGDRVRIEATVTNNAAAVSLDFQNLTYRKSRSSQPQD